MNKDYRVKVNADFFLNVSAKDNIQARNQVLAILEKYKDELHTTVNGMDFVEVDK